MEGSGTVLTRYRSADRKVVDSHRGFNICSGSVNEGEREYVGDIPSADPKGAITGPAA